MAPFATLRRATLGVVLVAMLAACSSAPAPTPRPTATPTPAPTASATPTAVPTPTPLAVGEFAGSAAEILAYWKGQGFVCDPEEPSFVGYNRVVCLKDRANGYIDRITVYTDEVSGKLVGGRASVIDPDFKVIPPDSAFGHLSAFVTSMLGATNATSVNAWLDTNLGADDEETLSITPDLTAYTYTGNDGDKSQLYVEIGTEAFETAPVRTTPAPSAAAVSSWTFSRDVIAGLFEDNQGITFDAKEYTFENGDAYVLGSKADNMVVVAVVADSGAADVTEVIVIDRSDGGHQGEEAMGFAIGMMEPKAANDAGAWVQEQLDAAYAAKGTPMQETKIFGGAFLTFKAWTTGSPKNISLAIEPAE